MKPPTNEYTSTFTVFAPSSQTQEGLRLCRWLNVKHTGAETVPFEQPIAPELRDATWELFCGWVAKLTCRINKSGRRKPIKLEMGGKKYRLKEIK